VGSAIKDLNGLPGVVLYAEHLHSKGPQPTEAIYVHWQVGSEPSP
jgi:hypothetical protein